MDKAYWLFHLLSFQGKNPQNPETMSLFFSHFLPSGKGKSPLQADLICAADFRMRPASRSHKAPYNNTTMSDNGYFGNELQTESN